MKPYESVEELNVDLDYVRNNPNDAKFFQRMVLKYKAASNEVQEELKSILMDRMLDHNPIFLMEKVAKDNPSKIIYCNTQEDPFFRV